MDAGEPRPLARRRLAWVSVFVAFALAAVLLVTLQYTSPAFRSSEMILAVVLSQPMAFITLWMPGARLARLAGPPTTVSAALGATALSWMMAMVLPARIFELVRPIVLNIANGLPLAKGFAAIAMERVFDLGFLAALTLVALAGAAVEYTEQMRWSAFVLGAATVVGIVGMVVIVRWPSTSRRIVSALPTQWLRSTTGQVIEALERSGDRRMMALVAFYSTVLWIAAYLTCYVLLEVAGSVPLSPIQVLFVFVAATLGGAIAVTPGGLGTYEGAIVLALGTFGYPAADALVLAILMRIATNIPAVPVAIWFLASSGLRMSEIVARMRRGPEKH